MDAKIIFLCFTVFGWYRPYFLKYIFHFYFDYFIHCFIFFMLNINSKWVFFLNCNTKFSYLLAFIILNDVIIKFCINNFILHEMQFETVLNVQCTKINKWTLISSNRQYTLNVISYGIQFSFIFDRITDSWTYLWNCVSINSKGEKY